MKATSKDESIRRLGSPRGFKEHTPTAKTYGYSPSEILSVSTSNKSVHSFLKSLTKVQDTGLTDILTPISETKQRAQQRLPESFLSQELSSISIAKQTDSNQSYEKHAEGLHHAQALSFRKSQKEMKHNFCQSPKSKFSPPSVKGQTAAWSSEKSSVNTMKAGYLSGSQFEHSFSGGKMASEKSTPGKELCFESNKSLKRHKGAPMKSPTHNFYHTSISPKSDQFKPVQTHKRISEQEFSTRKKTPIKKVSLLLQQRPKNFQKFRDEILRSPERGNSKKKVFAKPPTPRSNSSARSMKQILSNKQTRSSYGKPSISNVEASPPSQGPPRKTIKQTRPPSTVHSAKQKAKRDGINPTHSGQGFRGSESGGYVVPSDTRQITQPQGLETENDEFTLPSHSARSEFATSRSHHRQKTKESLTTIARMHSGQRSSTSRQSPHNFMASFTGRATPIQFEDLDCSSFRQRNPSSISNRSLLFKKTETNEEEPFSPSESLHSKLLNQLETVKKVLCRQNQQRLNAEEKVEILEARTNRIKDMSDKSKSEILRMRQIIQELKDSRALIQRENTSLKQRLLETSRLLHHALSNMLVLLQLFEECKRHMDRNNSTIMESSAERFMSRMSKMMEREATRISMIALDRDCMENLLKDNKKLFDNEKAKEQDISEELSPCDYRQIYPSQAPLLKRKDSMRDKRSHSQLLDSFEATKQLRFSYMSPNFQRHLRRGSVAGETLQPSYHSYYRAGTANSTLINDSNLLLSNYEQTDVANTVERIQRIQRNLVCHSEERSREQTETQRALDGILSAPGSSRAKNQRSFIFSDCLDSQKKEPCIFQGYHAFGAQTSRPMDPYLMEDSESVEERSFGMPQSRPEREQTRGDFLQTSDFHKISQNAEWAQEQQFSPVYPQSPDKKKDETKILKLQQEQRKRDSLIEELKNELEKAEKELKEREEELKSQKSKIELLNQALCRSNLEREELNNKFIAKQKEDENIKLELEEMGQIKDTNMKLLKDLQEAQEKMYKMTQDEIRRSELAMRREKAGSIQSEEERTHFHKEIETLRARNKELQSFREKFRGHEDAIANILTLMLDKATAVTTDKHEVSFCREESLGSSLGRKEKKFLQDLIGCENFKFVENLKKQATQGAEQKLKMRNKLLTERKKEAEILESLIDTYGGLAKIGEAFAADNKKMMKVIGREIVEQYEPLQQARENKKKELQALKKRITKEEEDLKNENFSSRDSRRFSSAVLPYLQPDASSVHSGIIEENEQNIDLWGRLSQQSFEGSNSSQSLQIDYGRAPIASQSDHIPSKPPKLQPSTFMKREGEQSERTIRDLKREIMELRETMEKMQNSPKAVEFNIDLKEAKQLTAIEGKGDPDAVESQKTTKRVST